MNEMYNPGQKWRKHFLGATDNPMPNSESSRQGTLARGLKLLEILVEEPEPLTLSQISSRSGLDPSTTLRILAALQEAGYVVRGKSRRYGASPRCLRPLPLLHPVEQLGREVHRATAEIAQRFAVTAIFVIFQGHERMVLDMCTSAGSMAPYYDTWLRGPLHATGVGKALLSTLDQSARAQLLGTVALERYTAETITTVGAMHLDLARAAESGFVMSRDEYQAGVTNIAAVVRRRDGEPVGCLNVTAFTADLSEEKCREVGSALVAAAAMLVYHAPSLEAASRYCRL